MAKKVIVCCAAILVLGGLSYYSSYLHSSRQVSDEAPKMQHQLNAREHAQFWPEAFFEEEAKGEEEAERRETLSDPDSVQAATEEYAFYLGESSGYVIIYHSDKKTIYEYTTIPVASLPEEVQEEIHMGKGVAGEQELYEFLENYSS